MSVEDHSFDSILKRMLDAVTNDVDKREGSVIYDALAPAAAELAQMYIKLESTKNYISVDTATADALTELCYQNGVFRKSATKAILKGVFNIVIPINSRFSAEGNTYITIEKTKDFEYKLECEQAGELGNTYTGSILPIDYIDGLESALITEKLVAGAEEESDKELRERYRQKTIENPQDGNTAQYLEWAKSFTDIGTAKIFPLWNGANTVKVAITDRNYFVADSILVNAFQKYMDPGSAGLGNGVAPIGSKVTISGGIKKTINVAGKIVLAEGYTAHEGVAEAISHYLANITFVKNSVSYMRTAVSILDCSSIADLTNFTINGLTADITLLDEEIPIMGSVNLTVVSG